MRAERFMYYRIGRLVDVIVYTLQTSSQKPLGQSKPNYAPPLQKKKTKKKKRKKEKKKKKMGVGA